jgi:hypothetical protein
MSLRQDILHNFWLKLFSAALATVIWLAIHYSILNQSLTSEYIRVPVSVKTYPGDKRVFHISPDEVVVTAVGEDTALLRATRKDIRVNLDLTNFRDKESPAEPLTTEAPPDIRVLAISPTAVAVQQVSP